MFQPTRRVPGTKNVKAMRTYNIKFDDNRTGNRFNYMVNKDNFRKMRAFIISHCGREMADCFLSRLVDICDDIREMPVGLTWYIIVSKYEPYVSADIKNFNRTVRMMDNAARNSVGENYMPCEHTAIRISRTEKLWRVATLNADLA